MQCAYVEFEEEVSVPKALALSGKVLLGIPIAVTVTQAEKNRLAAQYVLCPPGARLQSAPRRIDPPRTQAR